MCHLQCSPHFCKELTCSGPLNNYENMAPSAIVYTVRITGCCFLCTFNRYMYLFMHLFFIHQRTANWLTNWSIDWLQEEEIGQYIIMSMDIHLALSFINQWFGTKYWHQAAQRWPLTLPRRYPSFVRVQLIYILKKWYAKPARGEPANAKCNHVLVIWQSNLPVFQSSLGLWFQ